MKRTLLFVALAAAAAVSLPSAFAASFTYHGVLQDAGKPAQGKYDIELTLYATPNGGSVVGGPLTLYGVDVNEGSFATQADFGPLAKSFRNAFVGVKVRNAGEGEFVSLGMTPAEVDTNSSCPGSWSLDGNAGNPPNSFLGTVDTSDLVFKSQNTQVATAYVTTKGPYPSWSGGAYNFILGQGVFIGGGGGSSSSDSSNANAAYAFGVVGGGQKNRAGTSTTSFGTVGGGSGNLATGNYATVAGGDGNQATGAESTVPGGVANLASGAHSFAAGQLAGAQQDGSFVWSDGTTAQLDSNSNEFDIRASGGMAINGTPKNSGIELSIFPSGLNGGIYSNLFMGQANKNAGILISAGDATSTNNNASLYVDQFDGTTQPRKLTVSTNGLIVNDPNQIPAAVNVGNVALNVVHSPGIASALFDLFGQTSDQSYFELDASAAGSFNIAQYVPNVSYTQRLILSTNGDLTVTANAFKPGGGSWTATSDRRIKQDVAPIHDALDTIMKLRPVNFRYTPEYRALEGGLPDKEYAGFIAQEYRDVFPGDVVQTSKRVPGAASSEPTIMALDPNPALITTVAAVQELAAENAELHHQVDELAARLNKLESRRGN